ncbi:Transcriptional regulator [Gaiella occulta]|uniref:Transcriptional regulator n=2 Tax=Gaiella occulta TaxID=1002870 RepID=A0A7M2YZZ2_9ACTN|nr:Transcriptional regulator [Gaiella occulta]
MRSRNEPVKWPAAGVRVTMEDVAREAGVSRALVSLVMRDSPKVGVKRRERVLAVAERLGYRPNAMARGLASRRTRTVGVLLNELHNPFYAEVLDGVDEEAERLGYRILIASAGARTRGEERAVEAFLEYRTDGIVLVGPRLSASAITGLAEAVPVVVVARVMRSSMVDSVANDDYQGVRAVVGHLTALGHRRIAHIDGGSGAGASTRRAAYARAMREHGCDGGRRVIAGDYTAQAGARAVERMLADGDMPTAIFAANDFVAAGAIDRLDAEGLRVPEDVSVVGYDDVFLAGLRGLSLTTVNQPRPEMGRLALAALVERIEEGRSDALHVRLTPELVVRSSTARPRGSALRLRA